MNTTQNNVPLNNQAQPRRFACLALAAMAALAFLAPAVVRADRTPEVPGDIAVGTDNKVHFHTYAVGVQIYVATTSATDPTKLVWTFKAPEAVLFDLDGNVVGIHYAGPTWETESGSMVVGARRAGVTVDATAIPWLKLEATSTSGPGVLERTTFIQRINTTGGLAPATGPTQLGEETRVPYTAEYYFYRQN